MQEIFPGIFAWSWFSERHGYDLNSTLVLDSSGNLCVEGLGVPIVEGARERLRELVASFPPEEP